MLESRFTNEVLREKYANCPQAMERYKISRKTLMKHANDAGAVIRFGKSVRIDIEKMDLYIEAQNDIESSGSHETGSN